MTRRYEARRARLVERVATAGLHVWLCIAVALSGALGLPAPARADDASEAALHFELGSHLYGSGDYAEALDHFLAANRLAPNPSYAFNIAQTYALLGRQRDAYNWYETHLTEYTLSEADRAESTARRDALAARLAIIDVTCDPPGAEVFLDRTELGNVGRAPRRLAVEPGSHVVFGRHVGHHESSVTVLAVLGAVVPAQLSLPSLEGTLTVVTEPPGATVRLEQGGASLGATPLEVTLPVGTHVLVIELAEHLTDRRAGSPSRRTRRSGSRSRARGQRTHHLGPLRHQHPRRRQRRASRHLAGGNSPLPRWSLARGRSYPRLARGSRALEWGDRPRARQRDPGHGVVACVVGERSRRALLDRLRGRRRRDGGRDRGWHLRARAGRGHRPGALREPAALRARRRPSRCDRGRRAGGGGRRALRRLARVGPRNEPAPRFVWLVRDRALSVTGRRRAARHREQIHCTSDAPGNGPRRTLARRTRVRRSRPGSVCPRDTPPPRRARTW
jgi:hypothetical protein